MLLTAAVVAPRDRERKEATSMTAKSMEQESVTA
jgi:hypothetical protein